MKQKMANFRHFAVSPETPKPGANVTLGVFDSHIRTSKIRTSSH